MYDFLRKVPLFAKLPEDDLARLCEGLETVELPAGEELFAEGSPGNRAFVIREGEVEILKVSGSRDVLLAVRKPGEVIGEMALLEDRPRMASVQARTDSVLLAIHKDQLQHLISSSPSAAEAMFYTALDRLRATESLLRQSQKMAQLGTLTAGVAHELNNPAAAVKRGAEQLEQAMVQVGEAHMELSQPDFSEEQWQLWDRFTELAQTRASRPPIMDAVTRSDREYEMEERLEALGLEECWELAPTLVNLDLSDEDLQALAAQFEPNELGTVIRWLNATYTAYNLFAELRQGAERISGIVGALKTYAYLDQAPVQAVDINKGLDDTLLILNHKLKSGINVRRDYDEELPKIQGYGSELNQVWTNLIDNAADALTDVPSEDRLIVLRTRQEGEWIVVDVEDNGPGIPEDIQQRMFEPFFTTKPPGVGTGLGLDISYNIVVNKHRGDIKIESEPGRTVFQVWLPLDFENCVVTPKGAAS